MILCTGCSFTYGEELPDKNKQAWPAILQTLINKPTENAALPGASNDYIFRTTINKVINTKPEIVVVQWSETNRLELHANIPVNTPGRYNNYTGPLQTNIRWTNNGVKFIDEYYKNWFNEKFTLNKWVYQVIALQEFLKNNVKSFIMVNAFGNQELINKYAMPEYEYILASFIDWPNGMTEWTYGTPTMPKGHPGPEGHKKIAERIYEYIINNQNSTKYDQ